MAGVVLGILLTAGLPLLLFVWAFFRLKRRRALVLGIACFTVFQMLLRIPLIQVVLPSFPSYLLFQAVRPEWFLVFLSLTAGIFEEGGRYLVMNRFLKSSDAKDALAFGIGHGGIEAILLVGASQIFFVLSQGLPAALSQSQLFALAGAERISAMTLHICLSFLVWRAVREKSVLQLLLAVFLHTIFNLSALLMLRSGISTAAVEALLGLFALILAVWTLFRLKHMKERGDLS